MAVQHKHRDLIIAWANGETIQYKNGEWIDIEWAPSWDVDTEYRIKPNSIFYRTGLFKANEFSVCSTCSESTAKWWEEYNKNFIKWITDWIEVEI